MRLHAQHVISPSIDTDCRHRSRLSISACLIAPFRRIIWWISQSRSERFSQLNELDQRVGSLRRHLSVVLRFNVVGEPSQVPRDS
jgi:hypothetical protein